ncbi:MAG: galactose-1-phosphate uridylyltransferase [Leucothrix sp.]
MSHSMPQGNWERRWHPLLSQWVIIAATTGNRPWNGAVVGGNVPTLPTHDEHCYLCPNNTRANGTVNAGYVGPWAFDNDYASFSAEAPIFDDEISSPLMRRETNRGRCRVLCWTEDHSKTLASVSQCTMQAVARLWQQEYTNLSQDPDIQQVLIFENKGQEIGVSNPHPHGQIYATNFVGDSFSRIRSSQVAWADEHNSNLFMDLIARPEYQCSLKIAENEHSIAIIPYFARFAYECWVIPKQRVQHIGQLNTTALNDLAALYQDMAKAYNVLFQRESPNITLLYNAPCDDHAENSHWQFHIVMQPPLREPDKLKYLAGYESGSANIVNPVQPEIAAARLREAFLAVEATA